MKYLIVVCVVVVVLWFLLRERKPEAPKAHAAPGKAALQAMVECSHCGVHLPRGEALVDDGGVFCSETHRLAGPRAG